MFSSSYGPYCWMHIGNMHILVYIVAAILFTCVFIFFLLLLFFFLVIEILIVCPVLLICACDLVKYHSFQTLSNGFYSKFTTKIASPKTFVPLYLSFYWTQHVQVPLLPNHRLVLSFTTLCFALKYPTNSSFTSNFYMNLSFVDRFYVRNTDMIMVWGY